MAVTMQRRLTKRERLVRAITNPDTIFSRDPSSPPPSSAFRSEKLNESKFARTLFAPNTDFGAGVRPTHSRSFSRLSAASSIPSAHAPLFPPELISPDAFKELPDGYMVRPLQRDDFQRGYLDVLRVHGKVGRITEPEFEMRVEEMRSCRGTYFPIVIVDVGPEAGAEGRIKGIGMLLVERKFLNHNSLVGRIEDIAVARDQKGKKIGLKILETLIGLSKEIGCMKCIVDCDERNEAFHAQSGFVHEGSMMVLKLPAKMSNDVILEA